MKLKVQVGGECRADMGESDRYVGSCFFSAVPVKRNVVLLSSVSSSCYGNSPLMILNRLVSIKLVRETVDSFKNLTCF